MNCKNYGLILLILAFSVVACSNKNNVEFTPNVPEITESQTAVENVSNTPQSSTPQEDLSGKVQYLTEEEFAAKITEFQNVKGLQYKGKTPCIVDFYADWCRPCVALSPILVEIAEEYKGQIIVYKVNVDKAQILSNAFGINSIPALFFFKPHTQPTMSTGAPSKEELKKMINDLLLQ